MGRGEGVDGAANGADMSIAVTGAVRAGTGLTSAAVSDIPGTARTMMGMTGGTAAAFPSGAATTAVSTLDPVVSSAATTTDSRTTVQSRERVTPRFYWSSTRGVVVFLSGPGMRRGGCPIFRRELFLRLRTVNGDPQMSCA